MGIRQYNPVTAGRRGASVSDFKELTKGSAPEKGDHDQGPKEEKAVLSASGAVSPA